MEPKTKSLPIGLAFIALLSTVSLKAFGADSPDQTAVRALVMQFPVVWNRHDVKALGDLLTEDAEMINVVGMHWSGRNNIVKSLTAFHRAMLAHDQIHFGDITLRLISADLAVVVATQTSSGEIVFRDGRKIQLDPGKTMLDTFVVVKRAGTWKIAHNQNTTVDEKAQRDNPVTGGWNGEIGK